MTLHQRFPRSQVWHYSVFWNEAEGQFAEWMHTSADIDNEEQLSQHIILMRPMLILADCLHSMDMSFSGHLNNLMKIIDDAMKPTQAYLVLGRVTVAISHVPHPHTPNRASSFPPSHKRCQ